MADQTHNRPNPPQRELGTVKFKSKGSATAQIDRIWTETQVEPRATARPPHASTSATATKFVIGSVHPKDPYAYLVDASIVALTDTHETWQLLYKLDMQTYRTAATVAATPGTLTVAFSSGPVTALVPASIDIEIIAGWSAPNPGQFDIEIQTGQLTLIFCWSDADPMDSRVYVGTGATRALAASELISAINASSLNAYILASPNGSYGITLTDTGSASYIGVPTGFYWTGDTSESSSESGASTITITGTGAVSRAFKWAWTNPGSGTYMGQGNTGATSARDALVTAINAYGPFAGVLTAASSGAQSFTLTSAATGTSAYVTAASSGTDIWTGEGTDYGEAAIPPYTWPDVLVNDNRAITEQNGLGQTAITWSFEVINPDSYTAATHGTAHPQYAACYLRSESSNRDGPAMTVTRNYRDLLDKTTVIESNGTTATVVQWDLEAFVSGYSAPALGTAHPTYTDAKLTSETLRADPSGIFYTISRRYEEYWTKTSHDYVPELCSTLPVTQTLVQSVAAPVQTTGYATSQQAIGTGFSVKVVRQLPTWTLTSYDFDAETDKLITTTRQLAATSTLGVPSAPAVGTDIQQRQISACQSIRTTRTIEDLTGHSYDYWRQTVYDFPALLVDVNAVVSDLSQPTFALQIRAGYQKLVPMRVNVSFYASASAVESAISGLTTYQPQPVRVGYGGATFTVPGAVVIADSWIFSSTGSTIETYTSQESDPNYTQYINSWKNTEKLINYQVSRWNYGYWKLEKFYVTFE